MTIPEYNELRFLDANYSCVTLNQSMITQNDSDCHFRCLKYHHENLLVCFTRQCRCGWISFDWQQQDSRSKRPNNCHEILIRMLLNPDWFIEVSDITFSTKWEEYRQKHKYRNNNHNCSDFRSLRAGLPNMACHEVWFGPPNVCSGKKYELVKQ